MKIVAAIIVLTTSVDAFSQPVAGTSNPAPMLDATHRVDWLLAYKFNASTFPTAKDPNCIFGGTPDTAHRSSQAFAVASSDDATLKSAPGLVGTSLSDPIGATFNEIYAGTLNFVVWNDQFEGDPRLRCGRNCTGRWGHSKGIIAWDDLGNGLFLQVTTPDWPGAGNAAVPRAREGNTLGCEHARNNVLVGQHFFALKLTPADTGLVLDAMLNASVPTDPSNPQIARLGGPPELVAKASTLGRITQSINYTDVTLSSGVRLISKASDLWVPPWQLISARLGGVPLRTATWRASPQIPTTSAATSVRCWRPSLGRPGAVEIATTGSWQGRSIGMSVGASHAKIGVSLDPARPFTILGDMNQQGALSGKCNSSQNGRGGLFFVMTEPTLYASVRQLLEGGTAPVTLKRRKPPALSPRR